MLAVALVSAVIAAGAVAVSIMALLRAKRAVEAAETTAIETKRLADSADVALIETRRSADAAEQSASTAVTSLDIARASANAATLSATAAESSVSAAQTSAEAASRSAESGDVLAKISTDERNEAVADRQRREEKAERASKSANLRAYQERRRTAGGPEGYEYRVIVVNDGPAHASEVGFSNFTSNGPNGEMPAPVRAGEQMSIRGKLLAHRPHRIDLAPLPSDAFTYDLYNVTALWTDGTGSREEVLHIEPHYDFD